MAAALNVLAKRGVLALRPPELAAFLDAVSPDAALSAAPFRVLPPALKARLLLAHRRLLKAAAAPLLDALLPLLSPRDLDAFTRQLYRDYFADIAPPLVSGGVPSSSSPSSSS